MQIIQKNVTQTKATEEHGTQKHVTQSPKTSPYLRVLGRLSIFVLCVGVLIGCSSKEGTAAISSGPVASGDNVWVDTVVMAPRFPDVIRDTTDQSLADKQTQYPLSRASFTPELLRLSSDDVSADIAQALIGKNVGDEVIVTVVPSEQKKAQYAANNTTSLPGDLFDRAGISLRVGDIRVTDTKWGVVKEIVGERPNHQYIVDLNPWDTYMELEYRLTIRQVGGDEYKAE